MTDSTNTNNPLLARAKMPGSTFTLPSQGLFYKDGELDDTVKNGEIYVQPMVTLDELIFKTPDKLYTGDAFRDVFSRCIPQVKKPLKLLSKDLDFLLICLRKVSLGSDIELTYTHTCENAKEHNYVISIDDFIKNTKRIDPTTLESFEIKLDNGQTVHIAPPRFDNILKIYQQNDNNEGNVEQAHQELRETLLSIIYKVDDITDKKMISEWLDVIKIGYIKDITKGISNTSDWGPDQTSTIVCKDCKEEIEVTTPLNPVSFFT